jgi:hypothetical protein
MKTKILTFAAFLLIAAGNFSCQNSNSSEFIGKWKSEPVPGYIVILTFNAEKNEASVSTIGTYVIGSTLSNESKYFISGDKMYPVFSYAPHQREVYFIITMLSPDCMKLKYYGPAIDEDGFIRDFVFDRIENN